MKNSFSRIITLLRKEHKLSQKQVASDLNISQALLSHYEKGVRECGLDFVLKVADYYNVSCDYLLGRAPERDGTRLEVDDIPEPDEGIKDNKFKGSLLPTLNKKLISNSLNIIFDILQKVNNKAITTEVSNYLMISVYKMFRVLYSINEKNPQAFFRVSKDMHCGLSSAAQIVSETNAYFIINNNSKSEKLNYINISSEQIAQDYPLFSTSLYNLIQTAESKMINNSM